MGMSVWLPNLSPNYLDSAWFPNLNNDENKMLLKLEERRKQQVEAIRGTKGQTPLGVRVKQSGTPPPAAVIDDESEEEVEDDVSDAEVPDIPDDEVEGADDDEGV